MERYTTNGETSWELCFQHAGPYKASDPPHSRHIHQCHARVYTALTCLYNPDSYHRYIFILQQQIPRSGQRRLPIPPPTVTRKLVEAGRQAWLDGFTSVTYAHIPGEVITHFPLWIVSFWNDTLNIRVKVRKPWIDAKDWVIQQLQQKRSAERRSFAKETSTLLSLLPWDGAKQGLSDNEPIHVLWRYLGPNWLASSDENDMLEILHRRIANYPELIQNLRVEGVELTQKLVTAFTNREMNDYKGQDCRWIRTLGEDIINNSQTILTIGHLGVHNGKEHWIAIVVEGKAGIIRYGDSFGAPIPPTLLATFQWWLSHHDQRIFQVADLPIAMQTDGFSCGMFAPNALNHFVDPQLFPLAKQSDAIAGRLRMFNEVAQGILERVGVQHCVSQHVTHAECCPDCERR